DGGVAPPAERSRVGVSDRSGGAGAHRDAEDVRPAAVGARGTEARRSGAAGEAPHVPDGGRQPGRPGAPDDGGAVEVPPRRRAGSEDTRVPAPVRGRRAARADGGRGEGTRGAGGGDAPGRRGRAAP